MSDEIKTDLELASDPNTDPHILSELSDVGDIDVKQALCENSSTPPEILAKLYHNNSHWKVRYYVSINPNTPLDILDKASDDEDWMNKIGVVENPNAPPHILDKLSKTIESSTIRREVAMHHNTPINTLDRLSMDTNKRVRLAVLYNINVTQNMIDNVEKMNLICSIHECDDNIRDF